MGIDLNGATGYQRSAIGGWADAQVLWPDPNARVAVAGRFF